MTQFALPPDPAERKHKVEQQKIATKAKPTVPPEKDSIHKMVFGIAVYLCLAALVLVLVPMIGGAFVTGRSVPGPADADGWVRRAWETIDTLVVVRRSPGGTTVFDAFHIEALGPYWWMLLVPVAAFMGVQLVVADKAAACRWHARLSLAVSVVLVLILGATIIDRLVAHFVEAGSAEGE